MIKRLYIETVLMTALFMVSIGLASTERRPVNGLWFHDNLVAWEVVPFDDNKRSPQARAEMLDRLGFKHFAYDWRDEHVPTFDEEIETLKRHHIDLLAWWFPFEPNDAAAKTTLETFKRHDVHPQLWVMQSLRGMPQTPQEWQKLLPGGLTMPTTAEEWNKLSAQDQAQIQKVQEEAFNRVNALTKTPQEQRLRIDQETDRIYSLAKLAAPYGCKLELYNHNGWFGLMDNEVAIIKRLKERGVSDVGIVYNFNHARDQRHDDTADFPVIWQRIQPYVVAVNITGIGPKGEDVFPSQGERDLDMMRTIEQSGWHGPIGLIAEKGGDAEVTLRNYMTGFDWLATELKQPGLGGPRPFPLVK